MDKWDDQYHLRRPDDPPATQDDQQDRLQDGQQDQLQDDQQDMQQDTQQWHRPRNTDTQQPQGGYWRRIWRMWSAFFIKLGISYLVSLVITMILLMAALVAKCGYDYAAMEALMEDEAAVTGLSNEVAAQITDYTVPIEGLAALLTIPVMIYMFYKDRVREKLAGIIPKSKTPAVQYLIVIAMGASLCIGLNGLFMIAGLSVDDESYVEAMEAMYSPSLPMQLLCLGLLTPVCEELTYRGLIFKRIRESSSFLAAALYSTIIFALMHGYLVEVIYAFIMGFIFAWLYEKYGSFLAPVTAHMTANIFSVLATWFGWFDWLLESQVRIGLLIVACAAIASTMYVLIVRLHEPEDAGEGNTGKSQNSQNI